MIYYSETDTVCAVYLEANEKITPSFYPWNQKEYIQGCIYFSYSDYVFSWKCLNSWLWLYVPLTSAFGIPRQENGFKLEVILTPEWVLGQSQKHSETMVLKHQTVNKKLINYSRLSGTHHTKFLQEIKENIYFTFIETKVYLKNK